MDTPFHNLVQFVTADGRRVKLTLDAEFVLGCGLTPNVNTARVTADEFAKISQDPELEGSLEFWFNQLPDGVAFPDFRIRKISIVDIEGLEIGIRAKPAGQGGVREWISYRLFLADQRHKFVSPRGGELNLGAVNPTGVPVSQQRSNAQLITDCARAMGLETSLSLGIIPATPLIRGLQWRGSHAPTELGKILDELRLVFVVKGDGSVRIEPVGSGVEPKIPAAQQIPGELALPGIDRRGKRIVFSSRPNAIINTATIKGPNPDTWQFVAVDTDRQWRPIEQLTTLGGYPPLETVKNKFQNVPQQYRREMELQLYRFIRLNPAKTGHRLLREVEIYTGQRKELTIQATLATPNIGGIAGLWQNTTGQVKATYIYEKYLFQYGMFSSILQLDERLLKFDTNGETYFPESNYRELEDGDLVVTASHEAVVKTTDGFVPKYFEVGFQQGLNGISKLNAGELDQALKDPETIIISRPQWQLYQINGDSQNRADLEDKAQAIAAMYLKGSGSPAKLISAIGFCDVDLSGVASEIRINQAEPRTDIKTNAWWIPRAALSLEQWKKGLAGGGITEDFPGQGITQADRISRGAEGATQPVVPLMPGGSGAAAGGADVIHVKVLVDGGTDGTSTTAASWTYTAKADNDTVLGTALTPVASRHRPFGVCTPGDNLGIACVVGGTFILLDAYEAYPGELCLTP